MDGQILQALANPLRIRILKSLQEGTKSYSDIMRVLGLDLERDRGKFTYHLNLLKQAKLIREEGGLYQLTDQGGTALAALEMPEPRRGEIPPEAQSDLDTAIGLTLAAMIVGGVLSLLFFFFVAFFFVPVGFFLLAILISGGLTALFLRFFYVLVYRPLKDGRVEEALTPALVLGILALLFAGIIPGILLILAYLKAKDAQTKILVSKRI